MADVSKVTASDGTTYDIKDATARSGLSDKMDKDNPTGTGALSINRKSGTTTGSNSVALGEKCTASGSDSFAVGYQCQATGSYSNAMGYQAKASGGRAHAEGVNTQASGTGSHVEGTNTYAYGNSSHTEGYYTYAGSSSNSKDYSHAEGTYTQATGEASHAEGKGTSSNKVTASGEASHAEGLITTASGSYSHAEGGETTASGVSAHAEGDYTTASGNHSHSEGSNTIASSNNQHVSGKFNVADSNGTYAEIIGNGTADNDRSNARTLDWSGNESLAGNLEFMENSNTGSNIPGVYWKEHGYGDAFKIVPQFSGTGDQNYLSIQSSIGGSGETPVLSESHRFYPSGGIMYRGTCNSANSDIDVTQSNNGLSNAKYVGSYYQDVNYRSFGKFTSVALTDGTTALEMYTQNFNTSGASVGSNSLTMYMNKSGTPSCNFSHPWAWLTALGLYMGMKTSMKSWGRGVKIRQSGGDWMCIIMCDNSIYTIRGGGGNHATMIPTLQLIGGSNMNITQTVSHSTNYSEFSYARPSNSGWVVFSFSNATANHEIIWL